MKFKVLYTRGILLHCIRRHQNFRAFSSNSEQIKPFKEIPGPSSLPIIGAAHHFMPWIGTVNPAGNFFDMVDVFHKKFGPIVRVEGLPRSTLLILYEPEHFEQVYKAEEINPLRPGFDTSEYYRGVLRKSRFDGYYGLTTAQGPKWRDFRTKVNPALLKPKLVKLYAPALGEIAEEMVERLIKLNGKGDYLQNNFDIEMTKWSLESVALVGLGARLGCLEDDLKEDHPARQLMKCAKDIIDLSFKVELLPPSIWKYIATPNFKKLMNTYDLQWDISKIYIDQAQNKIKERGHDVPEEDKSIIEKLIAIDERVAILMANEMLMAGIDTVAFTITGILYHLATNQGAQNKLREEIRAGESRRYLRACMKEALRIWAVVPSNLRRTSKEHVVNGYQIPIGIDVVAPNEYLSRMDKYFPRGSEFIPERWLADKTDPLYHGNTHPMVYAPFGIGVRSCIGRRIAELEIEVFLAKLIDKQKVTWAGPPLKIVSKIINSFAKPYNFRFENAP